MPRDGLRKDLGDRCFRNSHHRAPLTWGVKENSRSLWEVQRPGQSHGRLGEAFPGLRVFLRKEKSAATGEGNSEMMPVSP